MVRIKKESGRMIWIWHIPDEWPNKRIGKCVENTGTDRFAFMNA